MKFLHSLLASLALAVLTSGAAQAQCGTTAPANKFCGNDTGASALATWKSIPPAALGNSPAGTVLGNRGATTGPTVPLTNPVLGLPGTSTGEVGLAGATSGTAVLRAQAAAGSAVLLLPTSAGTLAASASSPLAVNATTGLLTCATCVTSSGGGAITGTAPITVSAAGIVSINAPYVALTASNGGIVYSGAANLAILNGTATARQMLQSGASAAPAWSTATWPATTAVNQILYSSAANTVGEITTLSGGVLGTNGSGVPSITRTPVLGVAGTAVGSIGFQNLTSGTLTISPATGALGTSAWTVPVGTDTFAGVSSTQTLTNKTLAGGAGNVLGAVAMTLGSDATGDLYYRSAGGVLTRLGIGSATNVLTVSGGLPSWQPAPATGVTSIAGNTGAFTLGAGLTNSVNDIRLVFDPGSITNCTLIGAVSANALTVEIRTQSGAVPSASSPCVVSFRSATSATGDYTAVQVTASTTFATGTSGSTFGSANNVPFRLWITAFNNAGTVVLGVSKQSSAAAIFPIPEDVPQSSTACSACTNATSAGVFYTTAAQTTKAIRILGYMEWSSGLATAGTWASGPTKIQLMGPGVRKPGDTVQSVSGTWATSFSTANTTPTQTGQSVSITPSSAVNVMQVATFAPLGQATANKAAHVQIARGGTGIGGSTSSYSAGGLIQVGAALFGLDLPGTTSSTAYTTMIWSESGGTAVWVGGAGDTSILQITEIQG